MWQKKKVVWIAGKAQIDKQEAELKLHYKTKAKEAWKKEKEKADVDFEHSWEGWRMAL